MIGFNETQAERLKIANIQASLFKLGYNVGKIDGKLGPKTTAAIKTFQKNEALRADGKITAKLLEQLNSAIKKLSPAVSSQSDPAARQ